MGNSSSYVDPKDAIPPSNASATCQAEYQYLYCVPGTYTYIFFGTIKSSLRVSTLYAKALDGAVPYIENHIKTSGDGLIGGFQYLITDDTNILIYVEDANRHNLTWGVCGAAIQGLNAWMAGTENGYSDATFQINDGKNWVGNGYIGALNEEKKCVFENAFVPNTTCTATNEQGSVYGYNGGKIC